VFANEAAQCAALIAPYLLAARDRHGADWITACPQSRS
jgi:hypothetical protein